MYCVSILIPIFITDVKERKFYLADKRGLAVLVTCDYQGELPQTENDAKQMREMFEQFEYDIHQLAGEDATLFNIDQLVKEVTNVLKTYN